MSGTPSRLAYTLGVASLISLLGLSGCKHEVVATAPPPPPSPAPAPAGPLDLNRAAAQLAAELSRFHPVGVSAATLTIDSLIDGKSCQETQATERMNDALAAALREVMTGVTVVPFSPADVERATLVVSGNLMQGGTEAQDANTYLVKLAMTDQKSQLVVAQAAARFTEPGLANVPTSFYKSSRAVMCDQAARREIEASEKKTGETANTTYLTTLPTSALLGRGQEAFDQGRWQDALDAFSEAARRVEGKQLRAYAGIWTAQWNLGRQREAETAYGDFVRFALATNTLKLATQFAAGRFDTFYPATDTPIYQIMIRQVATVAYEMKTCLRITGHTSRTGNEKDNQILSENRANYIKTQIQTTLGSRQLPRQIDTEGRGSQDVINGGPVDNDATAVDRRVEFMVVPCSAAPTR